MAVQEQKQASSRAQAFQAAAAEAEATLEQVHLSRAAMSDDISGLKQALQKVQSEHRLAQKVSPITTPAAPALVSALLYSSKLCITSCGRLASTEQACGQSRDSGAIIGVPQFVLWAWWRSLLWTGCPVMSHGVALPAMWYRCVQSLATSLLNDTWARLYGCQSALRAA